jgi:ABC-2 type transport system permease protein
MSTLRSGASSVRLQLLELARRPAFVVPTMGFPALFYTLFDLQYARAYPKAAPSMMLAYIAFAIIGVTLFQFGIGVAVDRTLPWERYLRTLPAPVWLRFASRIVVAGLFALCSAAFVVAVATAATSVRFSPGQWLVIAACAAIGAVPFVLFGLAIGYWTSPKGAVPIANIFYLLLSFAGGLWMPPSMLPDFARAISPFTPTRQFANLLWSAPHGFSVPALLALAAFAILFAIVAAAGYRRDRATRFA